MTWRRFRQKDRKQVVGIDRSAVDLGSVCGDCSRRISVVDLYIAAKEDPGKLHSVHTIYSDGNGITQCGRFFDAVRLPEKWRRLR